MVVPWDDLRPYVSQHLQPDLLDVLMEIMKCRDGWEVLGDLVNENLLPIVDASLPMPGSRPSVKDDEDDLERAGTRPPLDMLTAIINHYVPDFAQSFSSEALASLVLNVVNNDMYAVIRAVDTMESDSHHFFLIAMTHLMKGNHRMMFQAYNIHPDAPRFADCLYLLFCFCCFFSSFFFLRTPTRACSSCV